MQEFSKEVNVNGLHLLTMGVFVLYDWKWAGVEQSQKSSSEEGTLNKFILVVCSTRYSRG